MKPSAPTLANLALAAVLLLTPFLIGVTASAPYNAWYDLDENGIINIFDVVALAGTYQTTGDPGKNVTVTNWPTNTLAYSISTTIEAYSNFKTPWIPVNGYSKFSVCIYHDANANFYELATWHGAGDGFVVESMNNVNQNFVRIYDVPNAEISVLFENQEAYPITMDLDIYLIR